MAVNISKNVEASKQTTLIDIYSTGEAIAPETGRIAVYVDLALVDQHRLLEIQTKLKTLINRAREENYRRPSSGTGYWVAPLNGSKADIRFTLAAGNIVAGEVAIGMNGGVRGADRGSIILDACWKEMIDWANEQDGLVG